MDALELVVDEGRPANAARFFHLGADLLSLLDELSDVPVEWRVQDLQMSSAMAQIASPDGSPEDARLLRLVYTSLTGVGNGGSLSDEWSPDAVRVAQQFADHGLPAEDDDDWQPSRLRLIEGGVAFGQGLGITPELSQRLADIRPIERRMPGAVRGRVVGVNVSRGNRASLRLPSRRIVRVRFESSLRGALKDAMYQEVEMRGTIKQDGEGRVFHLEADEVVPLVEPEVRWTDLFGIDPGFTDGLPVEEFLEASRGEA